MYVLASFLSHGIVVVEYVAPAHVQYVKFGLGRDLNSSQHLPLLEMYHIYQHLPGVL